jgi:centrosomal protein CEP97
MSNSFHGTSMTASMTTHVDSPHHSTQLLEMTKSLIENFTSESLMTQSLDPTLLLNTSSPRESPHPSPMNNGNLYNEQSNIPIIGQSSGPLVTASKMMPVPESLMSPDCGPPSVIPQQQQQRPVSALTTSSRTANTRTSQIRPTSSPAATKPTSRTLKKPEKSSPSTSPRKAIANTTNTKIHQNQSILKHTKPVSSVATTEDEDEEEIKEKMKKKSQKQIENNHQQVQKAAENKEVEKSAILIQKLWRGYSTRKRTVGDIAESLQQKRTQDYIVKLTKDMETTKQALENERKIQQLQMQAINALWKKVSNMQTIPENSSGENGVAGSLGGQDLVQDLTKTCSMLTNQVRISVYGTQGNTREFSLLYVKFPGIFPSIREISGNFPFCT